jgi:hypothetical protein
MTRAPRRVHDNCRVQHENRWVAAHAPVWTRTLWLLCEHLFVGALSEAGGVIRDLRSGYFLVTHSNARGWRCFSLRERAP